MNTFDGVEASLKIDVDDLKLRRLKERFPGLKGADELAKMVIPAPDWVLPDFVPVGLSILGGPKKLGKSYLIMQWCKEIVLEGGSVFYFAGEDTHALHKMRQTQMDFPITSDYQYIAGRDDEFASPGEFFAAVEDYVRICRPDALFIDTMDKAIKPQSMTSYARDDYAYYRYELDPWSKLAHKHQVAILMATHSVKNANQIYSDPLDHIHGSTAISATADWILVMEPKVEPIAEETYDEKRSRRKKRASKLANKLAHRKGVEPKEVHSDWLQQGNRRQSEADLSDLDAKITWLEQEIDQYPSKTVSFFEIENGYDFGSQNV